MKWEERNFWCTRTWVVVWTILLAIPFIIILMVNVV